jgi:hypothetical protein
MNGRIIEVKADSLEEGKENLYSDDVVVILELVLCPGAVQTVVRTGTTAEDALRKAQREVPVDAQKESETIKCAARRVVLRVEGEDEVVAGKGRAEVIESVLLQKKGRRGFLGFGRTPNVYEVVIAQQAVAEIRFREKGRVHAFVRDYLARDLLTCVQDLRGKDVRWEEVVQSLNPKNNEHIKGLLDELLVPGRIDPVSALNIIEEKCRLNEEAKWQMVIVEAHREAVIVRAEIRRQEEAIREARIQAEIERVRELMERRVRLRGLDVAIAEAFAFYTSIDWYAKSQREPTGIPRYSRNYDSPLAPDKQLRETIPRYTTDKEAFGRLRSRLEFYGIADLYLQFLADEGLDGTTATLEQKCVAILNARNQKH